MADPLAPDGDDHTELSDEEREGLLPSYIATRADLFDAEQRNIAAAALRPTPGLGVLLDDLFLRDLHRSMFGQVWSWAGRYRTLETNIGIDPADIATQVRALVDDARTWIDTRAFTPDELGARFHHRLVQVHPFPNGNGRHGRIATDLLVTSLGETPFSWGRHLDVTTNALRARYLAALRTADRGDIADLIAFART